MVEEGSSSRGVHVQGRVVLGLFVVMRGQDQSNNYALSSMVIVSSVKYAVRAYTTGAHNATTHSEYNHPGVCRIIQVPRTLYVVCASSHARQTCTLSRKHAWGMRSLGALAAIDWQKDASIMGQHITAIENARFWRREWAVANGMIAADYQRQ